MKPLTRRGFLADVGRGMLISAVGYQVALDLQLTPALAADDDTERLLFGQLEPLVRLMQDTDGDRLIPLLLEKHRAGTPLVDLVSAAALANARTFGGEDYVGFHTMMALAPSYRLALELPESQRLLPLMKVMHRNSRRIQEHGGAESEVLRRVGDAAVDSADGEMLLEAVRKNDLARAEQIFKRISQQPADQAFNELLLTIQDNSEVHRVVMPYRAWDLLDVVGQRHAHTLLRQSVHYCVQHESPKYREHCKGGRDELPQLLDQYRLLDARPAGRKVDDGWVAAMAETIFASAPEQAAEAVAAALADGIEPRDVGESLSLAANQLVLRDAGRPESQARPPEKPVGSVHGDSIGVHASDAANAWRNMSAVGNSRNRAACLVLGAYQVAFDRTNRGGDFLNWQPYPTEQHLDEVRGLTGDKLLAEANTAIRSNDQARTCAAVQRYLEAGTDPRPVFALLRQYTISEDGALHAEKYYETVSEDFAVTRPALRNRHLLGLARVVASSYGHPAPGVREAQQLLAHS